MPEVPSITTAEVVLRVLVAGVLGGLIGFEREYSDQPAGFRTHILVSVGAALFTLAGAFGVEAFIEGDEIATVRFDPTRVAAQIVTGIGFLGAGAIVRHGINVRGLTTAASLWVTAAIGMAAGFGYWEGAVAASLVTIVSLFALKRVERKIFPRIKRGFTRFILDIEPHLTLGELAKLVEERGARVENLRILEAEGGERRLVAHVRLPQGLSPNELADEFARAEGVSEVDWTS
jgi:putative Mg2+ transporter-C (MgtC) family protein